MSPTAAPTSLLGRGRPHTAGPSAVLRRLGLPRFGLLARITLALLAVGLLPLAAASFRLLRMNREAMREQVLRTHAVAAATAAARVDAFLGTRRILADSAAAGVALAADPRSPQAAAALAEPLRAAAGVVAVAVQDTAGAEVIRAQHREQAALVAAVLAAGSPIADSERPDGGSAAGPGAASSPRLPGPFLADRAPAHRGANPAVELAPKAAPPAADGWVVVHHDGAAWLRLAVPLGADAGTLVLVSGLAPLVAELRPAELGEQAEVVLVDGRGARLAGPAAAHAALPSSMLATALSRRASGAGRFSGAGGPVLGAFAPVARAPWIVLSRQPAAVAEVTALALRRRATTSLLLALLLAGTLAGVARQTVVQPLRELLAAQRRLAGGAAPGRAGHEIAQLTATFAELERRLREREALDELFVGRYQVRSVVGEGAMGTVFEAWDPALERRVAIKTVRFDRWRAAERAELAARLRDEAVTVARFSHPNIVGLYDIQQVPEAAFLAMEYVDGGSLEHHLRTVGRLPVAAAVRVGRGIARGLAAAHANGIVHHDIKPANVLLGRDGAVKVVDFGISQVVSGGDGDHDAEALFGTPGFLPPETLAGAPFTPAGDLYALGVTLYRTLTGEMPIKGRSVGELVLNTRTGSVESPERLVPGLPPELAELVLHLLEKEPARRCSSAAEALRRLDALAATLESDAALAGAVVPAGGLDGARTERLGAKEHPVPARLPA